MDASPLNRHVVPTLATTERLAHACSQVSRGSSGCFVSISRHAAEPSHWSRSSISRLNAERTESLRPSGDPGLETAAFGRPLAAPRFSPRGHEDSVTKADGRTPFQEPHLTDE